MLSKIAEFSLKVRRRETPAYDRLYRILKRIRSVTIPVVKPLHGFLYAERLVRRNLWHFITHFIYYEPLFKSRCTTVGRGLKLYGGIPQIIGHLKLCCGENVILHGVSTFIGAKVFESPMLTVGNNSCLGYQLTITVGRDVTIGNNVMIGNRVTLFAYDLHPTNPKERHLPASPESSRPITIEDNVWIGDNCIIMKGVRIGEGSVISAGSVVTMTVPPNSLALGNPARCYPLMLKPETP